MILILGFGDDLSSGSSSMGGAGKPGADPELQSFLMMEQQKAQFQAMVIFFIFWLCASEELKSH